MIKIYKTSVEGRTDEVTSLTDKGIWVNIVNPTEEEILMVSREANLLADFLRAALDEEERSRIEAEDGQILVLINVPVVAENEEGIGFIYDTVPLGVIITDNIIVTVCLRDNEVIQEFTKGGPRAFFTFKRTRFLLQILFITATLYLKYLRQIDRQSNQLEQRLHRSMRNEELVRLLNLEKSLVYFSTSLRANEIVMEKLLRSQLAKVPPDTEVTTRVLKMYAEDEDLLEDVITENKQAIDMADIYTSILSNTMDAFASVISNNLNIVMKFLTSVTIVLALPTMIASFYGMNVRLPLADSPFAFLVILGMSLVVTGAAVIFLAKRRMFL
ncbi:MAG TPA: magnesium transporter CorA family protein [Firmicutes bacterium]|nr:magnesium transporter CorA family protein [Bacillota bacterium]